MVSVGLGIPNHDVLPGVSSADHHAQTLAGDLDLADLNAKAHGDLTDVNATQHINVVTQAELEAETAATRSLRPELLRHAPGICKAWVHYNTVTTTVILASYNVSGLTDNGTGDTTVTIDDDFSGDNYAVAVGDSAVGKTRVTSVVAGSVQILTFSDLNVTPVDVADVGVVMFGDQ